MRNLARTICTVAALTAAAPALAQAPATTIFDGTYRGVSRQLEGASFGGSTRACPPGGVPVPLTIINGAARAGSADSPMEGSVTPQGVLTMRGARGGTFQGSIDAQGRAIGRLTGGCS